jgi:hypothetical protein
VAVWENTEESEEEEKLESRNIGCMAARSCIAGGRRSHCRRHFSPKNGRAFILRYLVQSY